MQFSLVEAMVLVASVAFAAWGVRVVESPVVAVPLALLVGFTVAGMPIILRRWASGEIVGSWGIGEAGWFTLGLVFAVAAIRAVLSQGYYESSMWLRLGAVMAAVISAVPLSVTAAGFLLRPFGYVPAPNRSRFSARLSNRLGLVLLVFYPVAVLVFRVF